MVVLYFTDEGDIPSCPQFTSCLTLMDDLDLPIENWNWTKSMDYGEVFEDMDFSLETLEGSTMPYCGTAQEVQAVFSLPDTICQNTLLSPSDLHNQYAQAYFWRITDPLGLDSVITSLDFDWLFDKPGTYDFIRELLEYPPIEPVGDTVLCPDLLPWEVRPQSVYSDQFFLDGDSSVWSDVFYLAKAGEHRVWTEIQGCLLSETFRLEVEPCEVDTTTTVACAKRP